MKIAVCYHSTEKDLWSTPGGLAKAFENKGNSVTRFPRMNPSSCEMKDIISVADSFDVIMFCWAGPSSSFDEQLKILRNSTKTKIFIETGDDIPSSAYHDTRVNFVDGIFTPDLRCHIKYLSRQLPSVWLPCWCDDEVFFKKGNTRENKVITTCGDDRPCIKNLKDVLGDRFVNKRVWNYENTDFFNSGTVVFQYARYDEITRRIFEAGGCGNAVLTNRISADTGIYKLFKEDEDICFYSDENECLEKARKLLEDHEYRKMLSENLYRKITSKHLVANRVDRIVDHYREIV